MWLAGRNSKSTTMCYSMSFHPGLRLCAQWLKSKLCQGGIKWKLCQAADLRKSIWRVFYLHLNQIKWRDYAFLNCVIKRKNSWYPILKIYGVSFFSFLNFLSVSPSGRKPEYTAEHGGYGNGWGKALRGCAEYSERNVWAGGSFF